MAEGDRREEPLPAVRVTVDPPEGEECTIGDPAWLTMLPSVNSILEASLQGSSITNAAEEWFAVLVTVASRPLAEGAGCQVVGKFLGCENALKSAEVALGIKEGAVHLCGKEPCVELLTGNYIHVTRVRLWSLENFTSGYLTREGKSILTKLKRKDKPPARPKGPPGGKVPKRPTRERADAPRRHRRRAPGGGPIEVSSGNEEDEEDMFAEDEAEAEVPSRREDFRKLLRDTRERIAAGGRAASRVGATPWGDQGAALPALGPEAPPGGRRRRDSGVAQAGLDTGTKLKPTRATPLALVDQEASRGLMERGLIERSSKKHNTSALLLARAAQTSQRSSKRKGKSSGSQVLAKAIQKVIGKKKNKRERFHRKSDRNLARRVKPDPDGEDDDPDDEEDEESSSGDPESESEVEFEPPLRKRAAKSPGSVMQLLVKHAQDQLDRGALMEEGGQREDPLTGGVKLATYFALLIRPYHQAGHPLLRELYALAQTIDLLRSGKLAETADALASRFISVHTALSEGSWSTAAYLEMFPMEPVQSVSTSTMLEAQKHRKLVLKSQGYPTSGGRNWWPSGKGRGNYGGEKGRKGEGVKGKGKNKTRGGKDSWSNKGQNPWKENQAEPGKKEAAT